MLAGLQKPQRLLVVVGVAVLGPLSVVPLAFGTGSACQVRDTSTKQSYTDLQSAVNAARRGDTLLVSGTCTGTTTIATNLTLRGAPGRHASRAKLDGQGAGTSVVTISAPVRVAFDRLTITGGAATAGQGGGISVGPGATAVLNRTVVTGNTAGFGGGVASTHGRVVLNHSTVTQNTATTDGGGVDIYPAGALRLQGASRITDNHAGLNGGGISNFDGGTVKLDGHSALSGNTATGSGGGAYNSCDHASACTGALRLRGRSRIHDNSAGADGGGISNGGGTSNQMGLTVSLSRHSHVYSNTAGDDGGGIFNHDGVLRGVVAGRNVSGNQPDDVS